MLFSEAVNGQKESQTIIFDEIQDLFVTENVDYVPVLLINIQEC